MDEREPPGTAEWLEAQQKYWDAWLELTRQALQGQHGDGEPGVAGAEAVRQWWEASARAAPAPTRELFGRLVDLSAPYFEMAQQVSRDTAQESAAVLDAWLAGMRPEEGGTSGSAPEPGPSGSASWQLPLDAVAHVLSALVPLPGNPWQATKADALGQWHARVRENAERLLAIPAFGYTRETQEQYQDLSRLALAYTQALQEYNLGFAHLPASAAANAGKRLDAIAPDAPIDSLRRLYDLWVDAYEEEYAAYAMSDAYARRYARLVSALAALKRRMSDLLDEALDVMNLPTRREIDVLQRRAQESRRAERALRAEIEDLKQRSAVPPAPVTARRGGARRKSKSH